MPTAEELGREASVASRLRALGARSDVVALRVERVRAEVDACAWSAIGLGLAFTTVNVATFAAGGAPPWSASWLVAWLLDPMVSLLLIAVLRAEQITARWQVATGMRMAAVKWSCFAATYAMNTWASWTEAAPRGVVLHSIPPAIVLLGAEVAPELRDRLTSVALLASASPPVRLGEAPAEEPDREAPPADDDVPPPTDDVVDTRVRELADLLAAGCAVTGAQASRLLGCSGRTGRRLLAQARDVVGTRDEADGRFPSLAPGPSLQLVPAVEEARP